MSLLVSLAVAPVVALLVCRGLPVLAVLLRVRVGRGCGAARSSGVIQGGFHDSHYLSFSGLGSCSHDGRGIWLARHASKGETCLGQVGRTRDRGLSFHTETRQIPIMIEEITRSRPG